MKTFHSIIASASALLFCTLPGNVPGWGFLAHKQINRSAVFALPVPLFGFYKENIEYITDHAVSPDKRRYAVDGEAAHHYIDLDHYGASPFDSLPFRWTDAEAKFTRDSLYAHGVIPWHIVKVFYRLKMAFEEKDSKRILKYSADLGHYIGDAHVPLHCTSNYNGQLTNQHGIHGFWETRLPELFLAEYDLLTGTCKYIDNVQQTAWDIIKESANAIDSVLHFERQLHDKFPPDRKYSWEQKGNQSIKVYSREYSEAYDRMLNGMVERRFRSSVVAAAAFWYTAWLEAGQPDPDLLGKPDSTNVDIETEDNAFQNRKNEHKGHVD